MDRTRKTAGGQEWCRNGREFYAINRDYPEEDTAHHGFAQSKADIFIDDRNLGGLPDWGHLPHGSEKLIRGAVS